MAVDTPAIRRPAGWTRSYPPLVLAAVSVLVAAFVLPSSLNLPQSNPSTVLEYAPVPPEDDDPPPPSDGNSSSLGLGSSSSLTEGTAPTPPPPPPPPGQDGVSQTFTEYNCVGNPPRQTEDPMSPPCVPFFDGDNGGVTYQGVTGDTIRVLVYLDRGCTNNECPYDKDEGELIDLQRQPQPPCPRSYPASSQSPCDFLTFRIIRAMRNYFNGHFQTYGRQVQFWAYITSANTGALRKKDAAELWDKLKPFAVIDQATFNGHNEAFDDAMAARNVLVFTSETALPNAFYRKYPSKSWGFWPDVERWSEQYISYVCQKVVPYPVKRYGNPPYTEEPNGTPRRFGLFYTSDAGEPGLQKFAQLVDEGLQEQCNANIVDRRTFPNSGFVTDNSDTGVAQVQAVNAFMENGVTTVLYLGGIEGKFTHIAAEREYYPEIVLAGDLDGDNNVTARNQNPRVWRNAWATSFQLRLDRPQDTPGYKAYKTGDPNGKVDEARYANSDYRDYFMLYQAIQVAGPRLTPENIDEGFHAIPEKQSTDPYVAAFFFDPNDYTSVKDSVEMWWDPSGQPPGGADTTSASGVSGCYRMVRDGLRFLAGKWEGEDDVFENPNDPCTGFEGSRRLRPA